MKIRTRLLLFLLPTLIGSIALISTIYAYSLHGELTPEKFQKSLLLIILSAGCTILIMVATLYYIAQKISRPVQKLNNSALAIAAGQYGGSIHVQGPKEIAQLANTLNTMSECLHENINRLKENSVWIERTYGEYECSMLLQHLMLQKNIDACRSDAFAVKSITFFSENPKGILLDFPKNSNPNHFHIHLAEAEENGLEGMYQLLTGYKYSKANQTHTSLSLDRVGSILQWKGPQIPLVWSLEKRKFIQENGTSIEIESGDFFFLWNQGLISFYQHPEKIAASLTKVLKIFAQDGLETTVSMLQKELGFAMKRKDLQEDLHLLCFQILNI